MQNFGPVAQWIEQLPSKQWVVGSIPARATIFFVFLQEDFASRNKNPGKVLKTCRDLFLFSAPYLYAAGAAYRQYFS